MPFVIVAILSMFSFFVFSPYIIMDKKEKSVRCHSSPMALVFRVELNENEKILNKIVLIVEKEEKRRSRKI